MSAQIIPINKRLDQVWSDYISAKALADATGLQADGIEAGRAWRRWLDLFITPEQRQSLSGQVRAIR